MQSANPQVSSEKAIQKAVAHIGADRMKKSWSATDLELIGGQQFISELVVYRVATQNNEPRLAWKVEVFSNLTSHLFYFIDAQNGEVLKSFNAACNISGHHKNNKGCQESHPLTMKMARTNCLQQWISKHHRLQLQALGWILRA
ncbi:MAG: PepSY domain-containing protein [Lewinellaceae bacterium]|nr:PepSY domain-containing protein [Lewinellaceae bacterium]